MATESKFEVSRPRKIKTTFAPVPLLLRMSFPLIRRPVENVNIFLFQKHFFLLIYEYVRKPDGVEDGLGKSSSVW